MNTARLTALIQQAADLIHARTDREATNTGLCVQRVGLTGRTIHDPRLNPTKVRDHECPQRPAPPSPQRHNAPQALARSSTPPPGTGATHAPPYVA